MGLYATLLFADIFSKPLRTTFTFGSVTLAFVVYGLIAAFDNGLLRRTESVSEEVRLVSVERSSFLNMLPTHYRSRIEALEGVHAVSFMTTFAGRYAADERSFAQYAVHASSFPQVFPELVLDAEALARWQMTRNGAIIGRALADRYGWSVGDRIPLTSGIYNNTAGGAWEFTIQGIYEADDASVDESRLFFHHEYLEAAAHWGRDLARMFVVAIADGVDATDLIQLIDDEFRNSPSETQTTTETAFVRSMVNRIGDFGAAVVSATGALFFVVVIVVANVVSLSVHERLREYALVSTLGFGNASIVCLVGATPLLLCCSASVAGIFIARVLLQYINSVELTGLTSMYLDAFDYVRTAMWTVILVLVSIAIPAVSALRSSFVSHR